MVEPQSPRLLDIVLGVWLILSAFLWPHTLAQIVNLLIVGSLCSACAAIASRVPPARFVNVALAIWLFVSSWVLPATSTGTVWNQVIAAIVLLVVSLVPSHPIATYRH